MLNNFTQIIHKHRQAGVALDTNLFILLIVGATDCNLLSESSKTAQFDRDDFQLLLRCCSFFQRHIVTPSVVTEACNLLDTLNRSSSYRVFGQLAEILTSFKESHRPSTRLASLPTYLALGLADTSLFALAERNCLVLTDDLTLYGHICSRNYGSLNFNHLRTIQWKK
jgi:hypothetical protein